MTIKDNIYGKIKIEEPILLELLKSPSIIRLKKISQYGIPDKYYHHKNFSRYEHSVGVMVLLKRLGSSLEEQIAGLLHDVSALAFSHIADWVFSKGSQGEENLQDEIHISTLKKSDIPKILKDWGFSEKRIFNIKNFSLLEKEIPGLCADRIDYALREFKYWLNPKIVNDCIKNLLNINGEIVFANQKVAFDFAINFLQLQSQHWGGCGAMMRYYYFSKLLKFCLKKRIISKKDFYKDEEFILNRIEKSQYKELQQILVLLKRKKINIVKVTGERIFKKFRYVDPKILVKEELVRLSKINSAFPKILAHHRIINKKGVIV